MKPKDLTAKARFAFDIILNQIKLKAKAQLAEAEQSHLKEAYKNITSDLDGINEDSELEGSLIDWVEQNTNHYIDCQLQLLREIRLNQKKR